MKIFAHRGWSAGKDENTLLAFKKSIEEGVGGVEFDIRYGTDGRSVIVSHDRIDGGETLSLEEALRFLESTKLELLIEFKEYSDDLFVLVVQHLFHFNLIRRTTIFAFSGIARDFPWKKRGDIKLGIIASYPQDIKKHSEIYCPDVVLLGWRDRRERWAFKLFWSIFRLKEIFLKYPSIKFIIGVAYTNEDKSWLSKQRGIHGVTMDMPLL